jgi:hypothetical protein
MINSVVMSRASGSESSSRNTVSEMIMGNNYQEQAWSILGRIRVVVSNMVIKQKHVNPTVSKKKKKKVEKS